MEPFLLYFAYYGVGALILIAALLKHVLDRRRVGSLEELLRDPAAIAAEAREGKLRAVQGVLPSGRRAEVTFGLSPDRSEVRAAFVVDATWVPLMTIRSESAAVRTGPRTSHFRGLVAVCEEKHRDRYDPALASARACAPMLARAFYDYGIEEILMFPGKVTARLRTPLAVEAYAPLLGFLDTLASAVGGGPVGSWTAPARGSTEPEVHLHAVERAAARAAARCPYCHGSIETGTSETVACDRCDTVLHEECFREHGRCPVLGCGGGPSRQRAQERARG